MALARSLQISTEAVATMSPMDLLCTQLETDNIETRVDAMRRLFVVAHAIGRDLTLTKLIPYLTERVVGSNSATNNTDDHKNKNNNNSNNNNNTNTNATAERDEDEILFILAEQLGRMVPTLIPGDKGWVVLPILEKLASVEETVVRDKAVESINAILPQLSTNTNNDQHNMVADTTTLMGMLKRLAGAEWFTARVSAAGILPSVYRFLLTLEQPEEFHLRECRSLFKDLAEDDTPMVRRSAGRNLSRMMEAVAQLPPPSDPYRPPSTIGHGGGVYAPHYQLNSSTHTDVTNIQTNAAKRNKWVVEEMIPIYQNLAADEQDSVRLLVISASGSVGCALGLDSHLTADIILPIVLSGSTDLSWRVRHNLAKMFGAVAPSFGFQFMPSQIERLNEVFVCFSTLLQDAEAEVRASAVNNLAKLAKLGDELFSQHLSPLLPALADDPVMEVRSKMAQTIMDCTSTLPDKIILADFKPLLEGFLNDEFAEVQLFILSKLSRVSHLLAKMDAVVGTIVNMAKAPNWRVREAVGHLLPHLCEARGVSFFEDHLLDPWMKLLMDQVAFVRTSCVTGMPKLLSVAGGPWIQREILPHYTRIMEESTSYLTRITILKSYSELGTSQKNMTNSLMQDISQQLLRGLDDLVPNVRIVAAKGCIAIFKNEVFESNFKQNHIKAALERKLADEEDIDCKYFFKQAYDQCA